MKTVKQMILRKRCCKSEVECVLRLIKGHNGYFVTVNKGTLSQVGSEGHGFGEKLTFADSDSLFEQLKEIESQKGFSYFPNRNWISPFEHRTERFHAFTFVHDLIY